MANEERIYTVSQVNTLLKAVVEQYFPSRLTVRGEITNWTVSRSGHVFFDLKDENALLPCVMWKRQFSRVKFDAENGLEVLATGSVDVYVPQGRYRFIVDKFIPAGTGALQLAFEQMYKRLKAEGLFDEEHKKPLPLYPQRICIVTSESGAAIHDIKDSIWARWPCVKLYLYPVPVQGEGAAEEIAAAIRDVNRRNEKLKIDVMIVGRGGGSLEDLWAFNEEVLARAIYDSKIPIISAVGHEVDTTIADLVADKRASTPTKAGVTAVRDSREVLDQLEAMERRLFADTEAKTELCRIKLREILASSVFRRPMQFVYNAEQRADELEAKLSERAKGILMGLGRKVQFLFEQLLKIEPHRLIGARAVELGRQEGKIAAAARAAVNRAQMELTARANRLEGLDPKAVLKRGYSITSNKRTGRVVTTTADAEIGDLIITELADRNLIESEVKEKQNRSQESQG